VRSLRNNFERIAHGRASAPPRVPAGLSSNSHGMPADPESTSSTIDAVPPMNGSISGGMSS